MSSFIWRTSLMLSLSASALAQDSLNIPLDVDSLRTVIGSDNSQCPGCGIVTNVRELQADASGDASAEIDVPYANRTAPGGSVMPSPVFSTDKKLVVSNKGEKTGSGNWRITVRYDDGSYASFDQQGKPSVDKGDRIRVVSGRVEPF